MKVKAVVPVGEVPKRINTLVIRDGGSASSSSTGSELRSIDEGGHRLPVRIVGRHELPAAGVKHVAAALRGERMHQEPAHHRLAGIDQLRHHLEVLARLLVGPGFAAGRQRLELERAVVVGMADHAAGVPSLLLQEDRLDPRLVELVVQRGLDLGLGGGGRNRRQR